MVVIATSEQRFLFRYFGLRYVCLDQAVTAISDLVYGSCFKLEVTERSCDYSYLDILRFYTGNDIVLSGNHLLKPSYFTREFYFTLRDFRQEFMTLATRRVF